MEGNDFPSINNQSGLFTTGLPSGLLMPQKNPIPRPKLGSEHADSGPAPDFINSVENVEDGQTYIDGSDALQLKPTLRPQIDLEGGRHDFRIGEAGP